MQGQGDSSGFQTILIPSQLHLELRLASKRHGEWTGSKKRKISHSRDLSGRMNAWNTYSSVGCIPYSTPL